MKKKLIKIIALLVLSLGIFCCSNVFAYTEIYSEDFDSYTPNSCISNGNGTFGNWKTYGDACTSSIKFSSSPNSLIIDSFTAPYHSFNLYYDNFSLISDSEISAVFSYDVFLVSDAQYGLALYDGQDVFSSFNFNNLYNNPRYLISGYSNSTGWVSGDYDLSEYLIDKENSWVKVSFLVNIYYDYDVDLEMYVYKFSNSIYIDNLLVLTYNSFNRYAYTIDKINIGATILGDDTYIDNFTISDTIPSNDPDPIDATCGSSDRQTYSYPTTSPENFCATGELITPSLVYDGYGWNWSCSGLYGGESVSCEAYNSLSDPTITDVIDFDFDDFEYDFEEGDVSKNWLIDVFKFLFLPREETLQKFFTTFNNLKQKIPFGYIYLIRDKFKEVSLESTEEFALNLELLDEDYEVFSVTSLKEQIGENTFNIFYNTMKALIWIIFALYLITRVQKLFNNE